MLRCVFATLLGLAAAISSVASANTFGATVEKSGLYTRDLYALGGTVVVHATVKGDVTAAGAFVDIASESTGDVLAVGGNVNLNSRVLDDVRAAGGTVVLNGQVGDDAVLLGNHVVIDRGAVINGRGLVAGNTVDIDGRIQRNLHVAAHTVRIRGEIIGNVDITADRIEIAPGAILRGNLVYASANDALIQTDAQILGTMTHASNEVPRWRLPDVDGRLFVGVSLFFTATVLVLSLPYATSATTQRLRRSPWHALGVGALVFLLGPLLAVLFALSAFGVWLAVLLFTAVVLSIIGGYIVSILFLAETALRELRGGTPQRIAPRLAAVAVVLLLVTLLSWMPFVYVCVTLALIWFGMGAMWLAAFEARETLSPRARNPAPNAG